MNERRRAEGGRGDVLPEYPENGPGEKREIGRKLGDVGPRLLM
jgi:hypothetical protein